MKKDKKIKIYLGLIYTAIISLFLWFFFSHFSLSEITSYEFIKNNWDYLTAFKERNYLFTSTMYVIITIIWVLLLGFASPIILISGFLFGKWTGTLLALFSLTFGATFLYLIASFFFKDIIQEKLSQKFSSLQVNFKKNEFFFFLFYRIVGGIPFQIQNILPVLFNVKIKNYFFGSLIGMAPQIFIWSSLGSGLEKIIQHPPKITELIFIPDIYFPIIGLIVLLIISFFVKKYFFKD